MFNGFLLDKNTRILKYNLTIILKTKSLRVVYVNTNKKYDHGIANDNTFQRKQRQSFAFNFPEETL